MKKNLLIFVSLMMISCFSWAQVISDFENIPMNLMLGGTTDSSSITVVPNPHQTGINTSYYVAKFLRDKDGVPWGGFWSALPTQVDVTVNKYVHVKVWKPRISPVKFKLEGGAAGTLELASMYPQTVINAWQDMVFKFTSVTGTYPTIAFMPDFEDPLTLTQDITIYYDDIMVNNDSLPNTAAASVIEDFEVIPMNMMYGGASDSSYFQLVANPNPGGINTSAHVIKYVRDKDGVPWGGFFSATGIDVTTNKYMHVKVWKPRVSPIQFKIEGGADGTYQAVSTAPNVIGVWQDMVFDFSSKTGTYPTIVFMPDFEDPLTLTSDIVIYFDDIILNNDPNPALPTTLQFNLNMAYWKSLGTFNPSTDFVDVAGSFNGWTGGVNSQLATTNDSTYHLLVTGVSAGDNLQFKFRINGSWSDATCEFPSGGPNRTYLMQAGPNVYNAWYNSDSLSTVTFNVNMSVYHQMGVFNPATDYVDIAGNMNGWNGANDHLTTTNDSIYTITIDSLKFGGELQFKFRINGSWSDATCEFPSGGPNRTYMVPAGTSIYSAYYNNWTVGIPEYTATGNVQIYPNPMSDVMTVTSSVDLNRIVIMNMVGQQVSVFENLPKGTKVLDVSSFPKGLYLMTIYQKSGEQLTQKLVKE